MVFYRDFPDQDAGSLRCKELPCAVLDYQVLGESQTLENWGQLPHLRTLPPTSSSLPDFRSKPSWDTSKGKKQQRSLSCRGGNKETSETEPKTNPHFISKCQAPCSHSLCAGGRREQQEQGSYREMRTAKYKTALVTPGLACDRPWSRGRSCLPNSQLRVWASCLQPPKTNSELAPAARTPQHQWVSQPRTATLYRRAKRQTWSSTKQSPSDAFEVGWVFGLGFYLSCILNLSLGSN